jgi:hypothetical protein
MINSYAHAARWEWIRFNASSQCLRIRNHNCRAFRRLHWRFSEAYLRNTSHRVLTYCSFHIQDPDPFWVILLDRHTPIDLFRSVLSDRHASIDLFQSVLSYRHAPIDLFQSVLSDRRTSIDLFQSVLSHRHAPIDLFWSVLSHRHTPIDLFWSVLSHRHAPIDLLNTSHRLNVAKITNTENQIMSEHNLDHVSIEPNLFFIRTNR